MSNPDYKSETSPAADASAREPTDNLPGDNAFDANPVSDSGTVGLSTQNSAPEPSVDVSEVFPKAVPRRKLSESANFWSTITTAVTAAAALILSLLTYVQLNSQPEMIVALSRNILVGTRADSAIFLTMRPTFYIPRKSDVTAVVADLQLDVRDPKQAGGYWKFSWDRTVSFEREAGEGLVARWVADPGPVVVLQESPSSPFLQFRTTGREEIQATRWDGVLTAKRLGQSDLAVPFCVDIDPVAAQRLRTEDPADLDLRRSSSPVVSTAAGASNKQDSGECYKI